MHTLKKKTHFSTQEQQKNTHFKLPFRQLIYYLPIGVLLINAVYGSLYISAVNSLYKVN